jgi:hypothetical protein
MREAFVVVNTVFVQTYRSQWSFYGSFSRINKRAVVDMLALFLRLTAHYSQAA